MKKIIIFTFFWIMGNAQIEKNKFLSFGFDARNLIIGSIPTNNKPALDFNVKLGARYSNLEISIFYENFNKIIFQSYGVNINYITGKKINFLLGTELGSVVREGNSNFLMIGLNQEIKFKIYPKIMLGGSLNERYRRDLEFNYSTKLPIVYSGFINIYYLL
jgi:hypothetical protein